MFSDLRQFASGNSAFRAAYVPTLSRLMWTRSGMSRAASRARNAWSLKPLTGLLTFAPVSSITLFGDVEPALSDVVAAAHAVDR